MSYFEDASLVLIPSAQKLSKIYSVKPTDGTGDLTFTRSNDTASRVASNGLIEKVRTNLLLQSNSFNTTWATAGPGGATVTSGQADPDGGTSAWLLAKGGTTGRIEQNIAMAASEQTFSVVAKKGASNFLFITIFDGTTGHTSYFNLDTGAVGTQLNAVGSIVSLNGGWYRCSVTSTNANATGVIQIYQSDADGSVTGTTGDIYIYQSQFENGVATDYIATTTAAVSVGPVANVPRLDYLGSSCPRLLLEPQRTNLALYSESFDNSAWIKNAALVTANDTTSPDGYINADKLIESSSTNGHFLIQSPTLTAADYTFSVFAKAGERNWFLFRQHTLGLNASFNLATGTLGTIAAGLTATIEDYGNDWYRCSVTFTGTAAANTLRLYVTTADNNTSSYAGDNTSGLYLYGAGCELGSYATSYIPTLGAAVTRGADSCSKTGISSLINSPEGVLFVEVAALSNDGTTRQLDLSYGSFNTDYVRLEFAPTSNLIYGVVKNTSQQAALSYTLLDSTNLNKIAIKYKANDFALWVNGVEVDTDTSGTAPVNLDSLSFASGTNTNSFYSEIKQLLIFPTALTDAQLAELTSL